MGCYEKLERCKGVYNRVAMGDYPSQEQIIDHLERWDYGSVNYAKDFVRLLKSVENEFGILIKFDRTKQGYFIFNNEDDDFDDVVESYKIADSIGFSARSLDDLRKMKEYVQVSNPIDMGKTEHISQLLNVCISSKEVSFDYTKYGETGSTNRKVQPYQIREYQGRWYLIGIEPDIVDKEPHSQLVKFRAYGLDRMRNLKKGESFKRDKGQAFNEHYANVIGIVNGYNYQKGAKIKAENIRLRVDRINWEFIKTLAWHRSQKQVDESKEYVEFELVVKPTSELVQLILQWSPKVKVLKPASLKKLVLKELEKSVALYTETTE